MMSLPKGCNFQIISYGSTHEWLGGNKNKKMFEYDDDTMNYANYQIERFMDNFDGTEIYEPLKDVFTTKLSKGNKMRIFLLTDGEVHLPNRVIELIRKHCNGKRDIKLFTFGVGDQADQYLVEKSALAGRGDFYILKNSNIEELRLKVVDSLQRATDPYMEGCSFLMCPTHPDVDESEHDEHSLMPSSIRINLGDIQRNQLVQFFFIMRQDVFDNDEFICQFKCGNNPMTKSFWFVEFNRDKFISLDEQVLSMFASSQDTLESSFQVNANFSLSKLAAK